MAAAVAGQSANNVLIAASAGADAAQNNYLTHAQIMQEQADLAQAKTQSQINAVLHKYSVLDAQQQQDAINCMNGDSASCSAGVMGVSTIEQTLRNTLTGLQQGCPSEVETCYPATQQSIGEIQAILAIPDSVAPVYPLESLLVTNGAVATGLRALGWLGEVTGLVAAGATNSVATDAAAGAASKDYGVAFFGADNYTKYYSDTNILIGAPGGKPFFFMPLEDSGLVTNAGDAARYTGMAPSAQNAYLTGGDIYGISFSTDGMTVTTPTAADASGWPHFLEGGNTAVKLEGPNAGYLLNPTREFVLPGGSPAPSGSVIFQLGPNGEWMPLRRF